METPETLKKIVNDYRRKVQRAGDDVSSAKYQLAQHEKRLESMMDYQRECEKGFLSLPATAFYYAQRRECKLLLNHLAQELELQHECVDAAFERVEQFTQSYRNEEKKLQHYQQQLAEILKAGESEHGLKNRAIPPDNSDDRYSWIHVDKKIS